MNFLPPKPGSRSPFVFVNMAMTADGKIATANRAVHSFGSPRDLEHLYALRATADAVMCGARTVEISQATLGSGGARFQHRRLKNGLAEFPLRIIVSGSGSINLAAPIFRTNFSPIIILTTRRISRANLRKLQALPVEVKMFGQTEVNLGAALHWLRIKWKVKRLLCEGGGELNAAMFRAGLIDEIHLTFCPKIFGGRQAPTIADGRGFPRLSLASTFKFHSLRAQKGELFTVLSKA